MTRVDWRQFQPGPVIGVDEVGRGCLAGPVYAAAVVVIQSPLLRKMTDSKKLSPAQRDKLATEIHRQFQVGIGSASVEEIEQLNILWASHLAMKRAIEALGLKSGHVLVDGHLPVKGLQGFQQTTLVKGDLRCAPISAASIVAKVTRDQMMSELGLQYPAYGFAEHKGYGTPAHHRALAAAGPTPWHRRHFAGVKELIPDLVTP